MQRFCLASVMGGAKNSFGLYWKASGSVNVGEDLSRI